MASTQTVRSAFSTLAPNRSPSARLHPIARIQGVLDRGANGAMAGLVRDARPWRLGCCLLRGAPCRPTAPETSRPLEQSWPGLSAAPAKRICVPSPPAPPRRLGRSPAAKVSSGQGLHAVAATPLLQRRDSPIGWKALHGGVPEVRLNRSW